MRKFHLYILPLMLLLLLNACNDDDSFTVSRQNLLTMSLDTVRMDTVFSRIPASTRSFWIYNNSGDGIRCSNVRLQKGNQSGFRVNVDGIYLGEAYGYQTNDISVRKGDSIRVFVELTSPESGTLAPKEIEDNIVFTLESGVQQVVNLNAWTWDADVVRGVHITNDSVIDNSNSRPLVVYGDIVVDSLATLTIAPGSTIYFHDNAGIKVHGSLLCKGTPEKNVTLRCDRLDRMFDYLPYDNLPGRWQGVKIYEGSYDNVLEYTDLHGAYNGVDCDSCDASRQKITILNSTIHNCQGYGLRLNNSKADVVNTQITNTLNDCLMICGGNLSLLHTTLAQFYPFDASRGAALSFMNMKGYPLENLSVRNSIITGYNDDVLKGMSNDTTVAFNYNFSYSLIRTPEIEDSIAFSHIVWEDTKDTIVSGAKNFVKIDIDMLRYDFHLDSLSKARGTANPLWALPYNRDGMRHEGDSINMGCY